MTKVPNLFRNDPPQSTQTGRGNVRKVAIIPGRGAVVAVMAVAWFMEIKNPADLSVGRVQKWLKQFTFGSLAHAAFSSAECERS